MPGSWGSPLHRPNALARGILGLGRGRARAIAGPPAATAGPRCPGLMPRPEVLGLGRGGTSHRGVESVILGSWGSPAQA